MFEVPGFVDLQVNGGLGVDFSGPELTEKDFRRVVSENHRKGTAALLATVITVPEELYRRNLSLIARALDESQLAQIVPGIHLEGPFISRCIGAVGAHRTEYVRDADCELFKRMFDWANGRVKLLTIAAESPGAERLVKCAVELGVTVSLGHQLASPDDISRCVDAGAALLTHLGNGCPELINRHHNPLWAGLAEERLDAMIITDGHHLPEAVVRSIFYAKGAEHVIITSDAARWAGLPPDSYPGDAGQTVVLDPDGLLHVAGFPYLVGSSSNILQCVNQLAAWKIATQEQLVEMALTNPLRVLGLTPAQLAPCPCYWDEKQQRFQIKT